MVEKEAYYVVFVLVINVIWVVPASLAFPFAIEVQHMQPGLLLLTSEELIMPDTL